MLCIQFLFGRWYESMLLPHICFLFVIQLAADALEMSRNEELMAGLIAKLLIGPEEEDSSGSKCDLILIGSDYDYNFHRPDDDGDAPLPNYPSQQLILSADGATADLTDFVAVAAPPRCAVIFADCDRDFD